MRRFWELSDSEQDAAISHYLSELGVRTETPTEEDASRLAAQSYYPAPEDTVCFLDPLCGDALDEDEIDLGVLGFDIDTGISLLLGGLPSVSTPVKRVKKGKAKVNILLTQYQARAQRRVR